MKAGGIIVGLAVLLMGFWGYPYLKTSVLDPVTTMVTDWFPGMNVYTALALAWLPLIVLGLIIFAGLAYFLGNSNKGGNR